MNFNLRNDRKDSWLGRLGNHELIAFWPKPGQIQQLQIMAVEGLLDFGNKVEK
jgi:hypothetical protein